LLVNDSGLMPGPLARRWYALWKGEAGSRAVLRHEPPERGEVDDDAVVAIGVPHRCDAIHLCRKGAEFGLGSGSFLMKRLITARQEPLET